MDKLFRSSLFIKVIAFLIAVMLYIVVSSEQQNQANTSLFIDSGEAAYSFTEQLKAEYDKDSYMVYGLPETVKIQVQGATDDVQEARFMITKDAYVNLENKGPGTHTVKIQTDGISNELAVNVVPETVTVDIQKKVTRTFPISLDIVNQNQLKEGYTLGNPELSPAKVDVTGGQQTVGSISYIKGVVNVRRTGEDITENVTLKAFDANGNKVDVNLNPIVTEAKIPVHPPSKTVPVEMHITGELPEDISLASVTLKPKKIKIYGKQQALDGIDAVRSVRISLNGVNKDKIIEKNLSLPDGVEKSEPKTVTITIDVASTEEKSMENIPVAIRGLDADDAAIEFIEPSDRSVDMTIKGSPKRLNKVQRGDILAYIDVTGLSEGTHDVEIQLKSPEYTESQATVETAKVRITKDNTSE